MGYTADKTAYNAAIDNDISTQTGANTIPPEVVGAGYTDLANLLEPYINSINNQAILSGTGVPSDLVGQDLDLYYRSQPTYFELYRKEGGTWALKVNVPFNVTLPEGNLTVQTSIDGFNAIATKGGWVIANTVYQKATQTGITVAAADLNFYRHDIIYATTSNTILYLQGTAAASPVTPSLPANTILIDEIVVPSSSSGFDPYLLFGGSGVNNISIDDVILNQDGFTQAADFKIGGTGEVGDLVISGTPSAATGTDLVLFRDPSSGEVKEGALSTFEQTANKAATLNYDGTGVKYASVDAVNDWARDLAKTATKTGLISKSDTFNLTTLDNFTARIGAVTSCLFWDNLFLAGTSPKQAIKSFPQKDYSLGQLITATGGNVNVTPLGADGKYVRYLGYDVNGNVYSSPTAISSNNSLFQIGFVTVIKSGATVSFLDGTAGPRNVFPQPSMASNTDFDKVTNTTTNVTVGRKSDATISTSSGTITGISVNWKSAANPSNSNPIDVYSVAAQTTASFVVIDPTFLTSTSALTTHTLLTDSDGGIPINNSFYNTTTGLRGTMANGSAAVARLMVGVRGGLFWQMGEFSSTACYADLTTAKNNIYSHQFSEAIVPPGVAFEIARVAYTKGFTVTNNDSQFYLANTAGGSSSASSGSSVGDATTLTKGILKLAGDLGGTADLPTVLKITTGVPTASALGDNVLFRDSTTGDIKQANNAFIINQNASNINSKAWLAAGGEVLKIGTQTGLSDFAYIGFYPRQATPITRSASIGFTSATSLLSITNLITDGVNGIDTNGSNGYNRIYGKYLELGPNSASTQGWTQFLGANNANTENALVVSSALGTLSNGSKVIVRSSGTTLNQVTLNSNKLGEYVFSGFRTVGTSYDSSSIRGYATEAWGSTAGGSKLEFYTTPNGTITQSLALTIGHDSVLTAVQLHSTNRILSDVFGGFSGSDLNFTTNSSGGANILFSIGAGAGVEKMRISSSGNVGIGINPTEKLHVNGNGLFIGDVALGTTTLLSGGGGAKWLTADGTTIYGGGLISSISGVIKALFYSENGDAVVQSITGGTRSSYKSSSGSPTALDIPNGNSMVWKNTTSGEVRLYANDGGTLKSVLLS